MIRSIEKTPLTLLHEEGRAYAVDSFAVLNPDLHDLNGETYSQAQAQEVLGDFMKAQANWMNRGSMLELNLEQALSNDAFDEINKQLLTKSSTEAVSAFTGLVQQCARIAESVGFDPKITSFNASVNYTEGRNNFGQHHTDGANIYPETESDVRWLRFFYTAEPGTVVLPGSSEIGTYVEGVGTLADGDEYSEINKINIPRLYKHSDDEELQANAQQVMPGKLMVFDPTQSLWHYAPEERSRWIAIDAVQLNHGEE